MARFSHRDSRGQALAEFAVVLPVFLLMLFGILDVGRVIWANDALANAAREGARFASVGGFSNIQNKPTYTKAEIQDHVRAFAVASGINLTVTVCYSKVNVTTQTVGCSGNNDEPDAANGRGNMVTVKASSTVPLVTGSFIGLSDFAVSGSSTVLINN